MECGNKTIIHFRKTFGPHCLMLKTIALFTGCISAIEILEQTIRLDLSKTKIKLVFIDGSIIFLLEIIIENTLCDYSYHWQKADGALIIRCDNAAHYPLIETFPHHKHEGNEYNVEASYEQTLFDVLDYVKNHLIS